MGAMNDLIQKINTIQSKSIQQVTQHLAKECLENGRISNDKIDEKQTLYYNLVYHTAEVKISEIFSQYASNCGELEKNMALVFTAESLGRLRSELSLHQADYAISNDELNELFSTENNKILQEALSIDRYNKIAEETLNGNYGSLGLLKGQEMMIETFRQFADEVVKPKAEHVHRQDDFIPDEIISGLVEMGAFGIAIPRKYGGYLDDYGNLGMMLVTEELSRGGLSIAGSLITRPEILSKALLKGGTEDQKAKWLPALASGEKFNAVAVTEPDYGSDVARMKVGAKKTEGGWLINGVKTWCTFAGYADVLMVLARTEEDPNLKHKGFSILLAEKPRSKDHKFEYKQDNGGIMTASTIPTIGYRGMHSFEVNFENYFVPDENLIGGNEGRGKGFYLQMAGFTGGRAQTASRANGVMQAAMEAACLYASERNVFGKEIANYQLTKWKIARMAMLTQASRQYSLHVANMMDEGKGSMEATLIKFYASRISEWVTREAMQIHGGMGYAEEYAVSRYFLDARVFSIFEGAEEVMALRVCAKDLLQQGLS